MFVHTKFRHGSHSGWRPHGRRPRAVARGAWRLLSLPARRMPPTASQRPMLDARPWEVVRAVVNSSGAGRPAGAPIPPRQSVAQLLAAKRARPVRSLDELAADTFESDQELEEFLAFTYSERHRDLA